jgi:hypothetical protein
VHYRSWCEEIGVFHTCIYTLCKICIIIANTLEYTVLDVVDNKKPEQLFKLKTAVKVNGFYTCKKIIVTFMKLCEFFHTCVQFLSKYNFS